MAIILIVRGLQILFAAVTLGLSSYLIGTYGGSAPALLGYGSFCGGAGLVIACIGVVAVYFDKLQGVIMLGLDVFAAFFLAAGALAFTATLKVGSCSNPIYLAEHLKLFQPNPAGDEWYNKSKEEVGQLVLDKMTTRCRIIQADKVFLWILATCFVATIVLSFFNRSGGKRGSMV